MIERYSYKEMSELWSLDSRFNYMLQVEQAVATAQGDLKIIPQDSAQAIANQAQFSLKGILDREKKTHHDVTAFINELASSVGSHGAYVHYGLTSSDVLDTALSLQIREASKLIRSSLQDLKKQLRKQVEDHKNTICVGRTHGIHAEPTSFGFKMLGHLAELNRVEDTFDQAIQQVLRVKLSGAVGTYSSLSSELEQKVCQILQLPAETLATQVIPRDRLARVLFSFSLLGCFLERLAVELRHLQKTEVAELHEGFKKGQTGSSAMPHKKNPISGENLTGISRLLRSYVQPSLENITLWHERDISHSSVERVILPDAFTLAHYGLNRMTKLLKGLEINQERMEKNLWLSQGLVFSSQVLNHLVAAGCPREEAYFLIQEISHKIKKDENFQTLLETNTQINKYIKPATLKEIFSGKKYLDSLKDHINKTLKEM